MIKVCPRCRNRYMFMEQNTDFIHICTGDSVLKTEDKLKLGNWEDNTGSGVVNKFEITQPTANILQGTEAGIYGGRDFDRTYRGKSLQRFRTKDHEEYIEVNKNGDTC